ncbi:hypothetical protein C170_09690 [Paenibacillus sp. FSL H7-689]|nr:hypothetical protein C170_09690 [Paenibacillus sp. FSL H7-689]
MSAVWSTNLNVCIPDLVHIVYGQGRTGCLHAPPSLRGGGASYFCKGKGTMMNGVNERVLIDGPIKRRRLWCV